MRRFNFDPVEESLVSNILPTGRRSFRDAIPEIRLVADLLGQAAEAHLQGHAGDARDLIRQADLPIVREWLESIWGKRSPYIHARKVAGQPIMAGERALQRMPSAMQKRLLIERDGHHCRLCGTPVIRAEVRKHLQLTYCDVLYWGRTNATQHAAFQLLWLQYDHLIPHARGGTNDAANMFVACAACNFGRMNWTLAEVGFAGLQEIETIRSPWDGLERILPPEKRIACAPIAASPNG